MADEAGRAETDEEREATYRFLNDEIGHIHRGLTESGQSLDTKATLVAGFAAAAIPFLLDNRRGGFWLAALLAYGAGLALSLAALWPRPRDELTPAALQKELSELAPVVVVGQIAGTKVQLFEKAYGRVRAKVRLWAVSVLSLGGGTVLLVVSTVMESRHG